MIGFSTRGLKAFLLAIFFCVILIKLSPAQQEIEFNYNGEIISDGIAFNGAGHFKFAIVNKNAQTSFWSNDNTSVAGSEPTGSLQIDVNKGFFSVAIGDTSLPGMAPLSATIFNDRESIFLRVWFSDNENNFQLLSPDRRIVNPALIGQLSQSERPVDIYVDPVSGDDGNNGRTTETAKQTIQAAWNTIPTLLRTTATIHLADGTYFETVRMTEKLPLGSATIQLIGNVASPESVVISGATAENPQTPIHKTVLRCLFQKGISIEGVTVEYAITGLAMERFSSVSAKNVIARNCRNGILVARHSRFEGSNLSCKDGATSDSRGIFISRFSDALLENISVRDVTRGVLISDQGLVECNDLTISDCDEGFFVQQSSLIFLPTQNQNTISNCDTGLKAQLNSVVSYENGSVTIYSNTNTPEDILTGSQKVVGATAVIGIN